MNADERDKLLDLHRAAMRAQAVYDDGGHPAPLDAAEDAFRDFLFDLDVTE